MLYFSLFKFGLLFAGFVADFGVCCLGVDFDCCEFCGVYVCYLLLLLAVCFGVLVLLLLVYINSVGMFGSYCR